MVFIKKRIVPLLIILLVALSVFSTPANAASPFKDVKTNHWAYSAIEWAYNEGITSGFPNGTFAPDSMITEAQFVSMLIRFDCTSANSFAANPGEHKASGNYRYLQSKNIPLNGYASTAMRDMPIKKGQVARVAAAFAGLDLSESHAVQYMYKKDLANGATGKNDYKDYGANQSMSRAEAAVFFQRLSKLGSCDLIGLSTKATGSNDSKTPLPPNFLGAGSVTFVPPEVKPLPPVFSSPGNVAFADVDIDKETLIANGKDSTFVTVSLKTCSGDPISYEESLSFQTTSNSGASIDGGNFGPPVNDPSKGLDAAIKAVDTAFEKAAKAWSIAKEAETAWLEYKPEDKLYFDIITSNISDKKFDADGNPTTVIGAAQVIVSKSMVAAEAIQPNESYGDRLARLARETRQAAVVADAELDMALTNLANIRAGINAGPAALQPTSAYTNTDGPDLTVEIIAPAVTTTQTDTLSFQYTGTGNADMGCYLKPATVQLTYVPQAELQIETTQRIQLNPFGIVQAVTDVTATIVRAGGKPITDYNGHVRFRSTGGATLSNDIAFFDKDGVAYVTVSSPWNGQGYHGELFAEIEQPDPRYQNEIASVLKETHSHKIYFEPELNVDKSCTSTDSQVAFIIDSSGSMQSSDKQRLRVSKSEEFILKLSASKNIASHFNSNGMFLIGPDAPLPVRDRFKDVRQSGGTNIADGLKVAFDKFTGTDPKIAILLTDGNSNERKVRDMIEIAKRDKIKVYTIGLGKSQQLNEKLLKLLASETGGNYFHVAENINLGAAYQSILSEILCGIPAPTCTISDQAFISPKLETRGSEFFMNTYMSEGCGEITRVVLRFNSHEGDIDYELAHRGQSYFELKKGTYEITNFNLLKQGLFLAYDADGKVVAQKYVDMK